MTLAALRQSPLVRGFGAGGAWDESWRSTLVDHLRVLCLQLWSVGVTDVFIDGSFCTDKAHPGDIDGYYACDHSSQRPKLLALDPIWDMGKRRPNRIGQPKPLMWHQYRIELFPLFAPPFEFFSRAATGSHGQPIFFDEFFRHSRAGTPRGIVRVLPEVGP